MAKENGHFSEVKRGASRYQKAHSSEVFKNVLRGKVRDREMHCTWISKGR